MSNIYIQEPATQGKVLLVTSAGDYDIELWSREAPRACRNFVQLCLEGYYNGTIFHRVVPDFIVQGGDPTGTGTGGESIYGKPFKDEFHTRLRFVRRGLVAMANAGPNDNGSQFFFTLGQTPELQNKHTIFGKITGNTLYNLQRFQDGIIGKDDRPEYPHKIVRTQVLNNPFPDIVPRMKIENEVPEEDRKKKKKAKGTKNFKLLSFGDEAEEEEEEVLAATKNFSNKGNSAHDIAMDPTLSSSTGKTLNNSLDTLDRIKKKLRREESHETEKSESVDTLLKTEDEIEREDGQQQEKEKEMEDREDEKENKKEIENKIEPVNAYTTLLEEERRAKEAKMAEMKAEIKQLKQDLTGKKPKTESENTKEEEEQEDQSSEIIKEFKKERQKYEEAKKQLPNKGASREDQTLALLQRFTAKMTQAVHDEPGSEEENHTKEEDQDESEGDDDTAGWMKHKFYFGTTDVVLAKDASSKDDHWYDVNDPRNALNKRRREDDVHQSHRRDRGRGDRDTDSKRRRT